MTTNTLPMFTLALSDSWLIAIFALNVLANFVALFVSISTKRNQGELGGLRADVKKYAEDAIDQKLRVIRTELLGKIEQLTGEIESANRRLGAGDRLFKTMTERDHQDELKTLQAIELLRRELAERFATKADFQKLDDRLRGQEQTCAKNHAGAA
jgi:hypothetical protein